MPLVFHNKSQWVNLKRSNDGSSRVTVSRRRKSRSHITLIHVRSTETVVMVVNFKPLWSDRDLDDVANIHAASRLGTMSHCKEKPRNST